MALAIIATVAMDARGDRSSCGRLRLARAIIGTVVRAQVIAIVVVVGVTGGIGYVVWRSHGTPTDQSSTKAGGSMEAQETCQRFISAMSAVCLRCTPKDSSASICAANEIGGDRCARAGSVRDPRRVGACLKDLDALTCAAFEREAFPGSCHDLIVFLGTDAAGHAEDIRKQQPQSDSPYRRCVRESIESEIAGIRRRGLTPDYKEVEKTAIFTCEATMGCVGERECNAKVLGDSKKENEVLQRWR